MLWYTTMVLLFRTRFLHLMKGFVCPQRKKRKKWQICILVSILWHSKDCKILFKKWLFCIKVDCLVISKILWWVTNALAWYDCMIVKLHKKSVSFIGLILSFFSVISKGVLFFVKKNIIQSVSRIWTSSTWLNLLLLFWWLGFRLEPMFDTASAASKNDACFKSGQSWVVNDHLASLI